MNSHFGPMSDEVTAGGFSYAYGRFYAQGRVERIDGSDLRAMFLPELTAEAHELLRDYSHFVRGQLQHYGVEYNEQDFSGDGTLLLQKALQAGKCDKVPPHVEELRSRMHTEWLENSSPEELAWDAYWIIEKYFLDGPNGASSRETHTVVGIPCPYHSNLRPGDLRNAANRVHGLHYATRTRHDSPPTVYLGWDQECVEWAAGNHAANQARAEQNKRAARERRRALKHEKYLVTAAKSDSGPSTPSAVGQYVVDCEYLEGDWFDLTEDMTLCIEATGASDIYQATFDFGVVEGIMMLGYDECSLEQHCADQDLLDPDRRQEVDSEPGSEDGSEYGSGDDCEDNSKSISRNNCQDVGADEQTAVCPKRKATPDDSESTLGPPPKQAKTAHVQVSRPREFFVRVRTRDPGTNETHPDTGKGKVRFNRSDFASFLGDIDMLPSLGTGVDFRARKVSARPECFGCYVSNCWCDYSSRF